MLSKDVPSLQFEIRWNGRLMGLERVARGRQLAVAGSIIGVVSGGVVVDGVRRSLLDDEPFGLRCGPLELRVCAASACAAVRDDVVDVAWWRNVAVALILAMGTVVGLRLTPKIPELGDDDLGRGRLTIARANLTPAKQPTLLPPPPAVKQRRPTTLAAAASAKPRKMQTLKQRRDQDSALAMAALRELGLVGPATGGVLGSGNPVALALSQLNGVGVAGGSGLGTRPMGGGGGGDAVGIGVIGSGSSTRGPGGDGSIDLTGRGVKRGKLDGGKIIYIGSMSREEIQRVVDRALSRIRYCYEKELNQDPSLEGKVVAQWTIGSSGDVVAATIPQSTFARPAVGDCVQRVMRSLKFPAPVGGGVVNVTYPFVFTAH